MKQCKVANKREIAYNANIINDLNGFENLESRTPADVKQDCGRWHADLTGHHALVCMRPFGHVESRAPAAVKQSFGLSVSHLLRKILTNTIALQLRVLDASAFTRCTGEQ